MDDKDHRRKRKYRPPATPGYQGKSQGAVERKKQKIFWFLIFFISLSRVIVSCVDFSLSVPPLDRRGFFYKELKVINIRFLFVLLFTFVEWNTRYRT